MATFYLETQKGGNDEMRLAWMLGECVMQYTVSCSNKYCYILQTQLY